MTANVTVSASETFVVNMPGRRGAGSVETSTGRRWDTIETQARGPRIDSQSPSLRAALGPHPEGHRQVNL